MNSITKINFQHIDKFSLKLWILINKINFHKLITSSNFDTIIDVHLNDEFDANDIFSTNLWNLISMKNFHCNDGLVQLQWCILYINFSLIYEFSSQWWIFMKMMNFHNNKTIHQLWIYVTMINFHHNEEFSLQGWISS